MASHTYYIYSNIDFSKKSASQTRMLYYAKALANEIDSVYILSCSNNKILQKNFTEIHNNIFIQTNVNIISGPINSLVFLSKMYSFSKHRKGKKTFLLYPYPLLFLEIFSILYLKFFLGNSVYIEFNEIRKYSSSFHSKISFKKIKYSIKKISFISAFTLIEPLLYFFDGLVCISTNIEKYGRKYNKNTLRIPILTDSQLPFQKTTKTYKTSNRFNIGFSGSIAPSKENLRDFIEVLDSIINEGHKISFNLCGNIAKEYKTELSDKIKEKSYLKYYGNLSNIELSNFLSQQDLLVIPRGFTKQNNFGFSTKLSDYLNHKKIILVTDISDNALFIKNMINGFIVPPNDNQSMRNMLVHIISNYDEFNEKMIENLTETSEKSFNYTIYEKSLVKFLKN